MVIIPQIQNNKSKGKINNRQIMAINIDTPTVLADCGNFMTFFYTINTVQMLLYQWFTAVQQLRDITKF